MVLREFDFFDDDVIREEMDTIPSRDAAKLVALMEHYETAGLGDPSPAKIQDYGNGILSIRHIKPAYQGRVLFYVQETREKYQKLCVLTCYKKESQDVPRHILERAKNRKATHESSHKAEKETEK